MVSDETVTERSSEGQGGRHWPRDGGGSSQAEDGVRVKTQKWRGQGAWRNWNWRGAVAMLGGGWVGRLEETEHAGLLRPRHFVFSLLRAVRSPGMVLRRENKQ